MINPSKEKMDLLPSADKINIEEWFEKKNNSSYFSKARVYCLNEKCELIMEEEKEVIERFTFKKPKNPRDNYFATKVTDNIFIIENTYYTKDNEGNPIVVALFFPYVKDKFDNYSSSYCFKTFEKALFAAICLENNLDMEVITTMEIMLDKMGKKEE